MDEISGCVLVPEVISTCKCVRAVWMRLVGVWITSRALVLDCLASPVPRKRASG